MDHFEDYYAILGVSCDATQEQIKAAYRRLCKIHHPDVGGDAATMQLLNKAYATLSDETLRGTYDAEYSARINTPPPGTVKAHIIDRLGQTSEEYIPIRYFKFDITKYRDENGEIYIYKTQKMNSVIKRTFWYSIYFYHNKPDTIVTCYVYDPKRGISAITCPISKIPFNELDRINDNRQLFVIYTTDGIQFCSSLSELETEQRKDKRKRIKHRVLLSVTACIVCVIMLVGYLIYNPSPFYSIQRKIYFSDAPEDFLYIDTHRIITLNSKHIEIKDQELTQFEKLRLKHYKRLIQKNNVEFTLRNPYGAPKREWSSERRVQYNSDVKSMTNFLDELIDQGAIAQERAREIYKAYVNGEETKVRGVEFYAPTKIKRVKNFADFTPAQKTDYRKQVLSDIKSGDMSLDDGRELLQRIKEGDWDFDAEVSEYITGDISDLPEKEYKRIQTTLNGLATEYAEAELNNAYKLFPSTEQDTADTVYVTQSGKKYHRANCQHVRGKKYTAISRSKAEKKYTPCSKCRP